MDRPRVPIRSVHTIAFATKGSKETGSTAPISMNARTRWRAMRMPGAPTFQEVIGVNVFQGLPAMDFYVKTSMNVLRSAILHVRMAPHVSTHKGPMSAPA
ncbi:hypothetical protein GDO81_008092 [Engystomops pustulosus]|uniref:Uncharacterized protein n=1 Tax=Engystomops pustulosus TaxID=76066 RepID=A0AAV7CCZ3_ENGPU|nr:hypothetical protein GDO81_008092 [Engystomops pustulosus]